MGNSAPRASHPRTPGCQDAAVATTDGDEAKILLPCGIEANGSLMAGDGRDRTAGTGRVLICRQKFNQKP